MTPAIIIEDVFKKYSRNANSHLSYGLRDLMRELFGRPVKTDLRRDEFYAVNGISLALNPGDTLGIVGRNGSGKTTLMKMINGLTKPDRGRLLIKGRIQALINLGSGFNSELSGRDNIFNSAALMGLSGKETRQILDEIIDFSELEDVIGSPFGTYSSGMKARLGFAVAVHLRPEILLVDEILAVGDYAFQNKCFIKMHELKKAGVTIVLISHSHTQIVQMCEQALWMHDGKESMLGPSKEVVQSYLAFLDEQEKERTQRLAVLREEAKNRPDAQREALQAKIALYSAVYHEEERLEKYWCRILSEGRESDLIETHKEMVIEYGFTLKTRVSDLNVSFVFFTKEGRRVSAISSLNDGLLGSIHTGEVKCTLHIPDLNLCPGNYVIVGCVHEGQSYLFRDVIAQITVTAGQRLTWHDVDFLYQHDLVHHIP